MKSLISLILFLNIFPYLFAIIPNWDITEIGEDLMTGSSITYTVCSLKWYEHSLTMTRTLTKGTQGITKENKVIIGSETRDVEFDNIESFYHFKGNYYICPKGNYHLYNFTNSRPVIPNGFVDKGIKFDLKCYYHTTHTFLVSYLMNGQYYLYGIYVDPGPNIETIKKIPPVGNELYDFKLDSNLAGNDEYYMLALINDGSYIKLSNIKATLRKNYNNVYDQSLNQIGDPIKLDTARTYMQGYFKVSDTDTFNDFFYIAYENINKFYSGFSTYAPDFGDLSKVTFNKSQASFEFYEDVEIEVINFMMYNRYVYYKMKLSSTGETKYYGIYDTKLNNVIFNTEEYIKYFIPYSDREMLAVTNTAAYKICAMKGTDNTCKDYCSDYYLLDTKGNKCSTTDSCPKIKLVPSGVCNETCDENIYHLDGTNCGLCQYFNPTGNKYKLVGSIGCRGSINEETMEYYNQKFNLLKCKDGYEMKNNDCVLNVVCYETCETCTASSTNPVDQKCSSCKSGYYLENTNCVKTCQKGYEKTGQICQSCNDNICKTFVTDSCDCTNCSSGFFINQTKRCSECDKEKCKECTQTATTCTSCWGGNFLYNSKCYECAKNCTQYENDKEKCKCSKCNEGFYVSNYQCESCVSNCLTCINSTKCLTCKSGYFIDSNGQCSACPIEKCGKLKSDGCQCETCADNYFMDNNQQCQQCSTQCKTCLGNANNCTSCSDNSSFINENNQCVKCDPTCETCSINSTHCTSCSSGKYVTEENKCDDCDDICETCFSGPSNWDSNCLSCKDNYYLINDYKNKTCVNDCALYEREVSDEPFKCKPLINGTDPGEKGGDNEVDYMLWIFIIVAGVLLIIITIIICVKCCHNKSGDVVDEITTELMDKEEIIN